MDYVTAYLAIGCTPAVVSAILGAQPLDLVTQVANELGVGILVDGGLVDDLPGLVGVAVKQRVVSSGRPVSSRCLCV